LVGLPGDEIEGRGTTLFINGSPHDEPYLPLGTPQSYVKAQHIPAGKYFMLGDNRANSADSRAYGPVDGHDIHFRAAKISRGKPAAEDPDCFSEPGAPAGRSPRG
jgi:signal peptidase I